MPPKFNKNRFIFSIKGLAFDPESYTKQGIKESGIVVRESDYEDAPFAHAIPPGESWTAHRRAVLEDLSELKETCKELKKENKELLRLVSDMTTNLSVLSTKVGLYAAGMATITSAAVAIFVEIITKLVSK